MMSTNYRNGDIMVGVGRFSKCMREGSESGGEKGVSEGSECRSEYVVRLKGRVGVSV